MNLSVYGVLSQLVLGLLLYACLSVGLDIHPELWSEWVLAAGYVLGYFVNAIAAWVEKALYWTWGGKPSDNLLAWKGFGRIGFYEHDVVRNLLLKKSGKSKAANDHLFQIAMRVANEEGRIWDMNGQYAFARSLVVTVANAAIILAPAYYCNLVFWVISFLAVAIAWVRAKERAYYYAKEVLKVALNKLENISE